MAPDFARLYAYVGVDAACDIEEFRHACRKRIGDLHPDRAEATATADDEMALSDLLTLYAEAVHFHQKHGRLPGAPSHAVAEHRPAASVPPPAAVTAARGHRPPTSHRWPMLVLVGSILLLGALAWSRTTAVGASVAEAAALPEARPVADTAPEAHLQPGMDRATVAAIQGEPLRIDGGRWEYGPSWLRFEGDALVDWYSSPLHPLKTAGPRPQQ
jgi:hypothetical protein